MQNDRIERTTGGSQAVNSRELHEERFVLSQTEIDARFHWKDFIRNAESWSFSMPNNESRYLYRGMRVTTEALAEILQTGIKASKTYWGEIDFMPDPADAVSYGFLPGHSSNPNIPTENFHVIVLQVDEKTIPPAEGGLLVRTARSDVPIENVTGVWIFDKAVESLRVQFRPVQMAL